MQKPGEFPPIYFVPGDTVAFSVELTNDAGDPVDLTGATAEAEIRSVGSTDLVARGAFTISAPSSTGILALTLAAADSLELRRDQNLVWDLQITYADNTVRTVVSGVLVALRDVTQ